MSNDDLIKTKEEIVLPKKIKGMIYGEPGIGKSTLALSMPAPVLLIDFDEGVHRVQSEYRTDTAQLKGYDEFKRLLETKDLSKYKSFVIDGFGKYIERLYAKALGEGKKSQQTWGRTLDEFKRFNLLLNDMPQHVCYVAHQKARKTKDEEGDKFGIDGSGSSKNYLIGELDFVGYMEMIGKRRSVSFSPSEKFYAKNSIGIEDYIEIPILKTGDANTFLADVIVEPTLKKREEESKQILEQQKLMEEATKLIEQLKDNPNECLNKFKEMNLNTYNKIKLFNDLKKATKLVFNEEKKIFEAPQEKANGKTKA